MTNIRQMSLVCDFFSHNVKKCRIVQQQNITWTEFTQEIRLAQLESPGLFRLTHNIRKQQSENIHRLQNVAATGMPDAEKT